MRRESPVEYRRNGRITMLDTIWEKLDRDLVIQEASSSTPTACI